MSERSDQKISFRYNENEPQRLDKYLVDQLPEYSRSRIQGWIKDGLVLVDGVPAQKSGQMLEKQANVQVFIPPPEPSYLEAEAIPLDIIFENEELMVVNKPAGMVVHPGAGHRTGTLVHAALAHAPDIEGVGGVQRPGVVHRLDKDTSGLILLAKKDAVHRWLQMQFRKRQVEKAYLALVDGKPPTPYGRIEAAIGRDERLRQKMAIVAPGKGREAISEYQTLEQFPEHTLLEVKPITGRTHQIRLHLAFIRCPVAGDRVYGRQRSSIPMEGHFLHAGRLSIRLPGEEEHTQFTAPLPEQMQQVLEKLRRS